MTSQPNRSKKQIIQDIEEIARQPGFIHILVLLCRGDLFLKPGEAADKDWRESLSYQELGFLAGLMIKYPLQNAYPDEEDLDNQIEAIDRLFQELHDAYTAPMIESFKPSHAAGPQPQQSPPSQNPPYGAGDYFAEGIFYDGSGAYDFQYLDLAAKRFQARESRGQAALPELSRLDQMALRVCLPSAKPASSPSARVIQAYMLMRQSMYSTSS